MVITSTSNEQIKNLIQLKEKAKVRKQKKQFVVEGIKMFSEVPKENLKAVYVSESFLTENQEKLQEIGHGSCNFYRKYRDILAKEENKRKKSFILFLRA